MKEYKITAYSMSGKPKTYRGKPQTYIATGKDELAEIILSFKGEKLVKVEEIES